MLKTFLNNIKQNSKIVLYNTGKTALFIKKYIADYRADLKIVFWADKNPQTDQIEGLKVIPLKELPKYKNEFDILIDTSRFMASELTEIFDFYDIPFLMVTREIEQYSKIYEYIDKQKQALEIFSSEESKNLYNMLWEVYKGKPYEDIQKYVYCQHSISVFQPYRNFNAQYLEYLNRDAIKTVIDAGFCNGIHSLAFKKHFKNLKILYALEPMYQEFKDETFDAFIQKENYAEIIENGLWKASTELEFCKNVLHPAASRVLGTNGLNSAKNNENLLKIKTTTINEIKEQQNIKKIDFIKMDIEGAEFAALEGGLAAIESDRPQMAVSIYHSVSDFVEIPVFLKEHLRDYSFYLGHYSYNLHETVLYAIPNELI